MKLDNQSKSDVVKNIKIEVSGSKEFEVCLSTQLSIEDTIKILYECQKKLEKEALRKIPIKKG